MFRLKGLTQICLAYWFLGVSATQTQPYPISSELFNSLEELSRLVDISYCVGTTGVQKPFQCLSHCEDFPHLELVTLQTWNTGVLLSDSCGYVALSHSPAPKRIIIAFRGTYSITNTIIDLSAYPQTYVPYPDDEDNDKTSNSNNNGQRSSKLRCENCTVHAGFMESWLNARSTVLPHVFSALEEHPDYEVTLVGHSLGGAVAALAGLEMHLKGLNPQVTTFGEPMIGNDAFVKFIDRQFHLGNYSRPADDPEASQFRRVTHVNDPVPLLPLREWGYAPHAGEIFISKADLAPLVEDVHICLGDEDPGCIAGAETPSVLLDMYQDVNIPLDIFNVRLDPCASNTGAKNRDLTQQVILGEQRVSEGAGSASCASQDSTTALYPRHWDWSLIPAQYRLWELFFAHRDYFWRIGLCVPGGDPTG
ncbi:hypothetical protein N7462_006854 [Penicillium macrosclerotiorum]|uniref:uncharacterized protein n=1 Tax=Penicillium macrosclerotiorum TaxID=303699 RepID=UPI0025471185|nr:uncharacterized protein N7462_006854 [Penicillium macrosclerotiorum]KAJ5678610.1 hypothetical protein N7462_006854 [Penicillium macrosclerotiorum]